MPRGGFTWRHCKDTVQRRPGSRAVSPDQDYDPASAASYWSSTRHELGDELGAVLSLGEPRAVNEAYDTWETGLLLRSIEGRMFRRGLDLGTGVGRVAVRVSTRLTRIVAADLAPGMLERARRNARGAGVSNLDVARLRSDRLPFRDASFDIVLCLGLLEHLPPETRRTTLRECGRVLEKGGVLALVLNNAGSVLLRDPSDNPHRVGRQQESGYYCAIVEEGTVLRETAGLFEDRVEGSNLFYSLHRHAARGLADSDRRSGRLRPFFQRAAAYDVTLKPLGPLADKAADHHLHLLVRR
jgi:SAM-dependent methyltransferase